MIPFLILLLIPIFVLLFIKFAFRGSRKKREEEYSEFLKDFEGRKFFCYTSRSNSKNKIETEILPFLNPEIIVVYMNGRNPESSFAPTIMIARMLYKLNVIEFPAIVKIEKNRVFKFSLKEKIYSLIHSNKNLVEMISTIEKY